MKAIDGTYFTSIVVGLQPNLCRIIPFETASRQSRAVCTIFGERRSNLLRLWPHSICRAAAATASAVRVNSSSARVASVGVALVFVAALISNYFDLMEERMR